MDVSKVTNQWYDGQILGFALQGHTDVGGSQSYLGVGLNSVCCLSVLSDALEYLTELLASSSRNLNGQPI